MDKKSILGFVLIGVILVIWLYWTSTTQDKQQQEKQKTDTTETVTDTTKETKDTLAITEDTLKSKITEVQDTTLQDSIKSEEVINKFGSIFYTKAIEYQDTTNIVEEKIIMLENEKVKMEFTNYGGTIRKFITKDYKTWDKKPVQLVDWQKGKELHLLFTSKDGKLINTKDLVFNSDYEEWEKINLVEDKDFKLKYELFISPDSSQKIVKTYSFEPDAYQFTVDYELINPDKFMTGSKYQVIWGSSLNLTEYRSDDEATFAEAFAYMGGELETMDASDFDEEYTEDFNGNTDYVSSRNKYFGVFIIPLDRKGDGAYLTGFKIPLKDQGQKKEYSVAVKMDVKNEVHEKSSFMILLTPLDSKFLKAYDRDLQLTMRFALDFIVSPIAQYFILPFFNFLHTFIPNYGFVIIVFSIILKILLHPLTKKQMESMKKMGTLNPKMKAIREKYKDDQTKANQQIMKLYKEEKINPAGGCLPLLLQMPILYALFGVFRSTIQLRQEPFILWVTDLSAPDVIFQLPFVIPMFGIDQVSGLATLMGITMFIQQKMTITDPKQKAFVYIMPIMLTLLFFTFPSGLNLYYFMFNLLAILQQIYTTKIKKTKVEPEVKNVKDLKKPKKLTFMEKMQKRLAEQQKAQRKRRR
jgi:YidC/Oxa1 family membrane protein insertase